MKISARLFILGLCLFSVSCGLSTSCSQNSDIINKQEDGCQYGPLSQDFKTDVAWVVFEWNCKPVNGGWGSGFLVDKERGVFYTNKHVSNEFDSFGQGSHKIFFNGKKYNVEIVKVPPLRDASVVRITDKFDPSEFPEPAPFASGEMKTGEEVFIEGFHPHPYLIIESNRTDGGYNEKLTTIWEKYYNLFTRNLDERREIVFEKMTAKVVEIDKGVSFGESGDVIDRAREMSNTYVIVTTDKDHKFSFGGLSGTAVKNLKGETVGIVTLEQSNYEIEKEETENGQGGVTYLRRVYNTIGFTPIESIANLRQYLEE